MIIGIGIDTVSISRIEKLILRRGEKFLQKVFSEQEIEEGGRLAGSAQFFAARFAAREAFFKAMGTGMGRGVSLRDIRIVRGKMGQPIFRFSARSENALKLKQVNRFHLSLCHEGDSAQAIVILEKV